MEFDRRLLFSLLAMASLLCLASPAEATPIFARQTGLSCTNCHFQHFPKLNAAGRDFKANGYSKTTQQLVEEDALSLPPVLNMTLKLSTQYVDATEPTQRLPGKIEFPPAHGAAILIGGRLAEGIGGYAEYDGGLGSGKVSFTLPFGKTTVGLTPFTADMGGAAYGFELLSTGANSMAMPFARAANPIGGDNPNFITSEKATGISFHAVNPLGFLVYAPFSPTEPGLNTGLALSNYVRAAVTPVLFGWDLALGGGYYGGATVIASASPAMPGMVMYRTQSPTTTPAAKESRPPTISTNAWFADAQAQGMLFDRELGFYALYGLGDNPGGLFGGVGGKPSGWGVSAEYTLFPQFGLIATYGHSSNGDAAEGSYQKQGVGFSYAIAQNILLQPVYEVFQGHGRPFDNRLTTLLSVLF